MWLGVAILDRTDTERMRLRNKGISSGASIVGQRVKLPPVTPAFQIGMPVQVPAAHFRSSSLLMYPGKQQMMILVPALPAPKRKTQTEFLSPVPAVVCWDSTSGRNFSLPFK